jgi:hypothetical protein
MKSSKAEYRIVTAPDGKFMAQRNVGIGWANSHFVPSTLEEEKETIMRMIAADDFIPTVVDVEAL